MADAGLSYDQACRAYTCMVGIVEDGVSSHAKISFGKIGCLCPVRKPPRDVVMGFVRGANGKLTNTRRVFHLDARTGYKFKLYRAFAQRTQLTGS